MKQKIILITGIMVFGLSACGSHEDEKIIKAEYEETEQVNEQVIEPETEQELSSETVADSMTETPEDEAASVCFAGSIHPMSCISPVTIRIRTGEEVTPEEVLGKTWEEIRKEGAIEEKSEENFNQDYGFYLTDTELCYVYRFNYFVDEIRIPR